MGKILEAAVTNAQSCDPIPIKDALTNLEGVQGITGPISYKGGDRMAIREITLVEIQNGERTFVLAVAPDPATVPPAQ